MERGAVGGRSWCQWLEWCWSDQGLCSEARDEPHRRCHPALSPACTKQCHQKPFNSKDNTEKHCPATVNPWHMKKAFKVMDELRSQNLLCHITIVAEDMKISPHRVALAACSPYFHTMCTGEMSKSRAKKVQIKKVDGWTLQILTDYVYTAEIQVT